MAVSKADIYALVVGAVQDAFATAFPAAPFDTTRNLSGVTGYGLSIASLANMIDDIIIALRAKPLLAPFAAYMPTGTEAGQLNTLLGQTVDDLINYINGQVVADIKDHTVLVP